MQKTTTSLKIKKGSTFLFIGDSITDCNRRDTFAPLGNGYPKIFNDILLGIAPEKRIKVINRGVVGHTTIHLKQKWSDDVIHLKPDYLSILIGINDLNRTITKEEWWQELNPEGTLKNYRFILNETKKKLNCKIIMLEPFLTVGKIQDSWRKKIIELLPEYRKVVSHVAKEFNIELIKLHDIFNNIAKYSSPETIVPDTIHPNETGHRIIAWEIMKIFMGNLNE